MADRVLKLIQEAIDKSRHLSRGLCPVYLVEHGIESSLRELSDNIKTMFAISCDFKCKGQILFNDNATATHVFYIALEAVNNAVKHSRTNKITIELFKNINKINMRIIDNGIGISENLTSQGMGLNIMKYRAKMIGGNLEIKPRQDGGTCVLLCLDRTHGQA